MFIDYWVGLYKWTSRSSSPSFIISIDQVASNQSSELGCKEPLVFNLGVMVVSTTY